MKIDILTIFPEFFESPLRCGLFGKAVKKGIVEVRTVNIRDFAADRCVDDKPFGGGSGMVMKIEPLYRAAESVVTEDSKVVIMSPRGGRFNQKTAQDLSVAGHLVIVCGRYEGIDARAAGLLGAREISIGDFRSEEHTSELQSH